MANRDNHYEAAFEEFLRGRGVPYIAVDEAKRSVLSDGASLKSLDFLVSSGLDVPVGLAGDGRADAARRVTWLVDVKGRRFPSGDVHKQYWKNESTRDDFLSLAQWEELLGEGFAGCSCSPTTCWGGGRRWPARNCSSSAAACTASWRSGSRTMRAMPGPFRPAGTPGRCRPTIFDALPGR